MSPHSVPMLGHRPNDILLPEQAPVYIGTRPDVSSLEEALLVLDRTRYEGTNGSPVETLSVGRSGDAAHTTELCAAWAIILASQQKGSAIELGMFVPGPGEFRELTINLPRQGNPS